MRRLRSHWMAILLMVVMGAGTVAIGCGGGKEASPVELVPDGSTLIGQVQLEQFLDQVDVASLYAAVPKDDDDPQTLDQLLDETAERTGIDFRQVTELALFGDISRTDDYFAIIARGRFQEEEIVAAIRKDKDASVGATDYRGRSIHTIGDAGGDAGDSVSLAVLEADILVVGADAAVRAVIDVQDGKRDRASGDLPDALNDLGKGLIRLVLKVPPEVFQDQSSLGELPFFGPDPPISLVNAFQDLDILGVNLEQEEQTLKLRAQLDFSNGDSASEVGRFLGVFLQLMAGLTAGQEGSRLLESLRVSTEGQRVSIRLQAPVADLSQMLSALLALSSSETIRNGSATEFVPGVGVLQELMPTGPAGFNTHVPVGQSVAYNTIPPTSGDHWAIPAACGFYEDEVPDETIVHNLEHGNIVVSYNFTGRQELEQLQEAIDDISLAEHWGRNPVLPPDPRGPDNCRGLGGAGRNGKRRSRPAQSLLRGVFGKSRG